MTYSQGRTHTHSSRQGQPCPQAFMLMRFREKQAYHRKYKDVRENTFYDVAVTINGYSVVNISSDAYRKSS